MSRSFSFYVYLNINKKKQLFQMQIFSIAKINPRKITEIWSSAKINPLEN